MSIPIYETNEDRQRERAVADFLSVRWNCIPAPSGQLAIHDYALCRHSHADDRLFAHAYLEIKCRSLHREDFWLSKHKWDYLLELSDTTNRPAFIAVHCATSDAVRYVRACEPYPQLTFAGRTDRPDDPNAMEDMVIIPLHRFTHLGCLRSSLDSST